MKLLFKMFGFMLKPHWKIMIAVFVLSVFFVLFNSLSLWISASFVSTLFSEEIPGTSLLMGDTDVSASNDRDIPQQHIFAVTAKALEEER
jgi:ABC-type multidrug transport system fused ATPase/permease subunit